MRKLQQARVGATLGGDPIPLYSRSAASRVPTKDVPELLPPETQNTGPSLVFAVRYSSSHIQIYDQSGVILVLGNVALETQLTFGSYRVTRVTKLGSQTKVKFSCRKGNEKCFY